LKIVTWNSNGALRKKHEKINEFNADLLVVQECEDPAQSTKNDAESAGHYICPGSVLRDENLGGEWWGSKPAVFL